MGCPLNHTAPKKRSPRAGAQGPRYSADRRARFVKADFSSTYGTRLTSNLLRGSGVGRLLGSGLLRLLALLVGLLVHLGVGLPVGLSGLISNCAERDQSKVG